MQYKQLNSRIEGTLRIATSASRSTPIVQQYLPALFHEYPSVHFEIYEGTDDECGQSTD